MRLLEGRREEATALLWSGGCEFFLTLCFFSSFRSNIEDVSSYEELKRVIAEGKWARGGWAAR